MQIAETNRLTLRHFTADDAEFVLELLNEPKWLQFIGDRGVSSLATSHAYIVDKLKPSYEEHGFGFYAMEFKSTGAVVGMCGLVKREALTDVDLGFALLERHEGNGFALEAAQAVLEHARGLGIKRLVAITTPDNERSQRLLIRLGFVSDGTVELRDDSERLNLYVKTLLADGESER